MQNNLLALFEQLINIETVIFKRYRMQVSKVMFRHVQWPWNSVTGVSQIRELGRKGVDWFVLLCNMFNIQSISIRVCAWFRNHLRLLTVVSFWPRFLAKFLALNGSCAVHVFVILSVAVRREKLMDGFVENESKHEWFTWVSVFAHLAGEAFTS